MEYVENEICAYCERPLRDRMATYLDGLYFCSLEHAGEMLQEEEEEVSD